MRLLLFLLVPAGLMSGAVRYARLGEFEGPVEVQLQAWDAWAPAQRNLPLLESTWVRTAAGGKIEMELDEGSAFRLGPESLAEISDYTRLSTGQRVTLLSLDHGIGYFTGQPEGNDALTLAVPGAQVTLRRGARIRLEAAEQWSQVAVIEGTVRFSSPAAEFDLGEGQTARVEPAHTSRFFLYREVTALDLDRWSEQRDMALASTASGTHVPAAYGVADLDTAGEWVQTDDLGAVWKPKVTQGWAPYRAGRWQWYDTSGYTWISDDAWGWLPYHYGRWTRRDQLGWVWAPSKRAVFKPGDVYWLRGAKIAGWGPLAPGEEWTPAAAPQQFLNANTTWSAFQQDALVIDPAGFDARPKEPLGVAAFALALPSPARPAARLEAVRPPLRAGSTRVVPVLPGVTYVSQSAAQTDSVVTLPAQPAPQDPSAPVATVTNPASGQAPVVVVQTPPPPPQEVIYPVPVYTGIVVVNPPEQEDRRHRRGSGSTPGAQTPAQSKPPAAKPPDQAAPTPTPTRSSVPRTEPAAESHGRYTAPPPAAAAPPANTSAPRPSVTRTEPERNDTHGRYAAPAAERPREPARTAPAKAEPAKAEPDNKRTDDRPAARKGQ